MKKKSLYIIIIVLVILLSIANNFFTVKIPFLDDSPLADFLSKVAIVYLPIIPVVLLRLWYKEWKQGKFDTLGMIILSVLLGIAFVVSAVASGIVISMAK